MKTTAPIECFTLHTNSTQINFNERLFRLDNQTANLNADVTKVIIINAF